MAEKKSTVTMKAVRYHTYDGKEYHEGDTYEADEEYVQTLESVNPPMAQRVPEGTKPTKAN